MNNPTATLRVGICGCKRKYRNRFNGQRLTIRYLGSRKLERPITVRLQEVRIPEDRHELGVLRARCHAFLDGHHDRTDRGYYVWLDLIDLAKDRIGRERVVWGWRDGKITGYWFHETLPSTRSVRVILCALIERLSEGDFQRWAQRMTPRGWKLPEVTRDGWQTYRLT